MAAVIERRCRCGHPASESEPGSNHKRTCPYWRPPIQIPIRDEQGQRLMPERKRDTPRTADADAVQVIMGTLRKAYDELEYARGHLRTLEDELRHAQLALGQLRDDLKEPSCEPGLDI